MRWLAFLLACALAVPGAAAQPPPGKKGPSMSREERQRMREDMRDAYRERNADRNRPDKGRQMSPEEREKLRRDIQDANRDLRR